MADASMWSLPVEVEGAEPSIRVVQNWFEEFRGRQRAE